jgi:hypothetical protein
MLRQARAGGFACSTEESRRRNSSTAPGINPGLSRRRSASPGGKGMNLDLADAEVLAAALASHYASDDAQPLANYTTDRPRSSSPLS